MDSDQYLYATSGEDFKETIQAFLEKRKGNFKGNWIQGIPILSDHPPLFPLPSEAVS